MGHDIKAVSGHKLNTSSMESLAKDLSDRLDVTIVYGYSDDTFIEGISKGDHEFIVLGKVEKETKYIWTLRDWDYLDRIVEPTKYEGSVSYDLTIEYGRHNQYLNIYKYVFESSADYEGRWWCFCRHFTGELDYWPGLDFFRRCVYTESHKLGGNAAIYFDDQGPSAFIFEMEDFGTPTFEDIVDKVKEKFGEDFLNISEFVTKYDDTTIPHKPDKYPLAFYDDFKVFRTKWDEE